MDKALLSEHFFEDDTIRAVDAKFEAQKIAFSPLSFQAVRTLLELGLLKSIEDAGEAGIRAETLSQKHALSLYGVQVLLEMALGMGVVRWKKGEKEIYVLGKIGWMLLEDELTQVNFHFVNDICYKGAFNLLDSVQNGKPQGLTVFGNKWTTIYEALSSLPAREKSSWFAFDHFYSDIAFPEALPIVFAQKPAHLVDIGGNTAKWALACCKYDTNVTVTIVDLPGQTDVAQRNIQAAGLGARIATLSGNILKKETVLPHNADAFWMSQFLDCFSLEQITKILRKIYEYATPYTNVYVLEPLWDKQHFAASAYSLQATSLYFTCMANGNSKMYRYGELVEAIEKAGFTLKTAHHNLGSNNYSLLVFQKKA